MIKQTLDFDTGLKKCWLRHKLPILVLLMVVNMWVSSCSKKESQQTTAPLFTKMPSASTGITFSNTLDYTNSQFNIYKYRNFYNGGGVAIGDVNNDGLPDVYMTSNQQHNKLYINKGNLVFEDATDKAGCAGTKSWATGVTMADVNADGWLDIYICNSGDVKGGSRENELFINNHDGTFTEQAAEYGLADRGLSTHAAFFDFDNDGDLDCYLLNNSFRAIGSFNLQKNLRDTRDSLGGHKLFRNDGPPQLGKGGFKDISASAGVYGSVQAFGLGVMVGDINRDGWQDIYVCNDFFERDYLYINQKNGTFKEDFENQFGHCGAASMGADLADVNNDGYPDIMNTEMLPRDNRRLKLKTTFDSWDRYKNYLVNGYYHQFTHNTLQINNGDNTFSEIAFQAGVGATDWSWGALMCDLDNDGWKDIFVANGIYQDLTDQDFIQFISDDNTKASITQGDSVNWRKLIEAIPSEPIANFAFKNNGNLTFTDKAVAWGLAEKSFSNGAAYGDLDNDGDLDLVVNNTNAEAFVYRNEANRQLANNRFLQFQLRGGDKNPFALGTKITVFSGNQKLYVEQMPMRGFQSSMDYRPHLGLGVIEVVDSIWVDFPNGKRIFLKNIKTNQALSLNQNDAVLTTFFNKNNKNPLFENITDQVVNARHIENDYSDFNIERLKFLMHSTEGPRIAVADVNGDGAEDVFVGGAVGQAGQLLLQRNGRLTPSVTTAFEADKYAEDMGCQFFDADGDGDLDLFVASGGSEGAELGDRLYKNDGKGNFSKELAAFSAQKNFATSVARPADVDNDGDMDLFIGGRFIPANYGADVSSYILKNDGQGHFKGATNELAPDLKNIGMVTDAQWVDIDGDKDLDLVVVGEWMPITIFKNENGKFIKTTKEIGLADSEGMWNVVKAADVDGDGDTDLLIGNIGQNTRFQATPQYPMTMYYGDFDGNGAKEQIVCTYDEGKSYPCALRHDLASQMPIMKKRYPDYKSYATANVDHIFGKEQLAKARQYTAKTLQTSIAINNGNGTFSLNALPIEAQYAPVYAIIARDFDKDGITDVMLLGNYFEAKPEIGRIDANYGLILRGAGKGAFVSVPFSQSAMRIRGQVRDAAVIDIKGKKCMLIAQNNDRLLIFNNL